MEAQMVQRFRACYNIGALRSFIETTMAHSIESLFLTRRELLRRAGTGFGMLGLAGLLHDQGMLGSGSAAPASVNPLAPRRPHFQPKARQVVHLFMNGGASH